MTSPQEPIVIFAADEGIARITLNRPEKRNALNQELIAGIKNALHRANQDQDVRAIILTGAGNDFCSGADLAALQAIATASVEENLADARLLMELFLLIRSVRPPVIAAVKGRALAGGCGLASACDLVLAARSSRFGYPEVKIGFVPAMVMAILRRNVSEKLAFELITTGRDLSADEAARIGLVNHVYDDDQFDAEVEAFSNLFKRLSKTAVAFAKRLLYQIDDLPWEESLAAGADINTMARMTEDVRRGIDQFLQKTGKTDAKLGR